MGNGDGILHKFQDGIGGLGATVEHPADRTGIDEMHSPYNFVIGRVRVAGDYHLTG